MKTLSVMSQNVWPCMNKVFETDIWRRQRKIFKTDKLKTSTTKFSSEDIQKKYLSTANGAYYARHEHFKRLFLYNTFLKEMQKMDGRTESQTDTDLWHSYLIFCTLNKVMCKIAAQYVKVRMRKVQKTGYFQYSKFQKGHNSYKN